jgi:hypothetical protein
MEKGLEEVAAGENKVLEAKTEIRTKVGTSLRHPPNRTVQFFQTGPSGFGSFRIGRVSRTTTLGTTLAPRWCPPGLTPSQNRRIQRMRVRKMREEAAKKERDEHFNAMHSVIPMKQEWRVKEKVDVPAPMTSDDDIDLLDEEEAPLIKDGSATDRYGHQHGVHTAGRVQGLRRRPLRCVLAQRRPCSRSPKSQANT